MPLIETESLVLKSYNLAEADRIVVFFTREQGIVRGVARGAKRLNSRFGSTLELFSTVQLSYFQKDDRELVSIRDAELLRSSFSEAADPAFLQTFSYVADLLLQFAPPNDPNEKIYRMLGALISTEARDIRSLHAIRLYFEVWLLRLGGYLPNWIACENCKERLRENEPSYLRSDFHLNCSRCRKSSGQVVVGATHREIYKQVQKLSPSAFANEFMKDEVAVREVSDVMKRIFAGILGREVSFRHAYGSPVEKNAT